MSGADTVPAPPGGRMLILFDGDCAWCTGWTAWLCRRDRDGRFLMAPLGGETARRYVGPDPPRDTMFLVVPAENGGRVLSRSRAVLGVLEGLGGAWRAAALLRLFPAVLADRVYGWVACRRHALPACPAARAPGAIPAARLLP